MHCGRFYGVEQPVGAGSTREKNAAKYLKHRGALFAGRAHSHGANANTDVSLDTVGAKLARDCRTSVSRPTQFLCNDPSAVHS